MPLLTALRTRALRRPIKMSDDHVDQVNEAFDIIPNGQAIIGELVVVETYILLLAHIGQVIEVVGKDGNLTTETFDEHLRRNAG